MLVSCCLACCGQPNLDTVPSKGWQPAFSAENTGWLLSVWASSETNVYASGGTELEGGLRHYDGTEWSAVELGVFGLRVPLLTWVHGFGPDSVTVVGNEGTVLHFDGQTWQQQATPTDQNLWGVWGAAPDDLWAVGGRGRPGDSPVLMHFDGNEWQSREVVAFEQGPVHALFKVWGTSRDNVIAVGQNGAVMRFDGNEWKAQSVGASDDLISLWGSGPDHIVAVGGRGNAIVSVFNGETWHTGSMPELPGLNGVWLTSRAVAHVVGERGTLIRLDPNDLSFESDSVESELDLHGVFGIPGERLFSVGGNFMSRVPPYRGIALTRPLQPHD